MNSLPAMRPTVRRNVVFHRHDDVTGMSIPVPVELIYYRGDPYAVHLMFKPGQDTSRDVRWVVSRDLLAAGTFAPTGEGDVQVEPAGIRVNIRLSNPGMSARFSVAGHMLDRFLDDTFLLVSQGSEAAEYDLDSALDALLDGAA